MTKNYNIDDLMDVCCKSPKRFSSQLTDPKMKSNEAAVSREENLRRCSKPEHAQAQHYAQAAGGRNSGSKNNQRYMGSIYTQTFSSRRAVLQRNMKLPAGLKELSLKVMEQVIIDGQTTYSKVASQLIEAMRENTQGADFAALEKDVDEDSDPEDSEDQNELQSPDRFESRLGNLTTLGNGPEEGQLKASQEASNANLPNGSSAVKQRPTGQLSEEKKKQALDKSEKNIRRRVYDALNVQFAACVLQKKDKFIMPNYSSPIFQRIYNYLYGDELQSADAEEEGEYRHRNNRKGQRKVQFAPNGDSCAEQEDKLDMDMIEKKRQKLNYLKRKLQQREAATKHKMEQ